MVYRELYHLQHDSRVAELCEEIRRQHAQSSRPLFRSSGDIPCLDRVLWIDRGTETVGVEANVSMQSLVDATLPWGRTPSVVACEGSMTVAEAFNSKANTSSSYAFGTFDCTVLKTEVIFEDGSLLSAPPVEIAKHTAPTNRLAIRTMFEISLIHRGPYVALEFLEATEQDLSPLRCLLKSTSMMSMYTQGLRRGLSQNPAFPHGEIRSGLEIASAGFEQVHRAARDRATAIASKLMADLHGASFDSSIDFVEAVMFEDVCGVIIGRTCASTNGPLLRLSANCSFADSARSIMKTRGGVRYMGLGNYLFRNDRHYIIGAPATEALGTQSFKKCYHVDTVVQALKEKCPALPIQICPVVQYPFSERYLAFNSSGKDSSECKSGSNNVHPYQTGPHVCWGWPIRSLKLQTFT